MYGKREECFQECKLFLSMGRSFVNMRGLAIWTSSHWISLGWKIKIIQCFIFVRRWWIPNYLILATQIIFLHFLPSIYFPHFIFLPFVALIISPVLLACRLLVSNSLLLVHYLVFVTHLFWFFLFFSCSTFVLPCLKCIYL